MQRIQGMSDFYNGRRVFITGHTGFKGSWLCLWLNNMGSEITGYSLAPPTNPNLFDLCRVDGLVKSVMADVRDLDALQNAMMEAKPEIVIHMAAQPLVRDSYANPVETFAINVMGTVNLLEALRKCESIQAVVNVTTDKVYANQEWLWGYRENEPLGGHDPYSCSKACSDLITASYRSSFFNTSTLLPDNAAPAIATARAGNVIGGGDWGRDRLIPDCIRAFLNGETIRLRNPDSIRPWQYVLEPLAGYLLLAQRLFQDGEKFADAWNFGPDDRDAMNVANVVARLCKKWGNGASYVIDPDEHPHEANYLKLDCSKAKTQLGWQPLWNLDVALDKIVEWTAAYREGGDLRKVCLKQIEEYESAGNSVV
jgi:CDP-glucose 4,6-dehydratase